MLAECTQKDSLVGGEGTHLPGAVEGDYAVSNFIVDDAHLKGVENIVMAVNLPVDRGGEPVTVIDELAFPDERGFCGIEDPVGLVKLFDILQLQIFLLNLCKG